jgi:hypothetical protein
MLLLFAKSHVFAKLAAFLRHLEAGAEYNGCFNLLVVLEQVCIVKLSVSEKALMMAVVGNVDWSWMVKQGFGIDPSAQVLETHLSKHSQHHISGSPSAVAVGGRLQDAKDSKEVREEWYKSKSDPLMFCDSSVTPVTGCIISSSDHVAAPCTDGETASRKSSGT